MLATDPTGILAELQTRGVRFTVVGDKLRWTPKSAIAADEIELLRRHKADLIHELTRPPASSSVTTTRESDWSGGLVSHGNATTGQTWRATTPVALADDNHG